MRSHFNGLALGLMIGLAGILALALAPGADLEEGLGLDWLFNLRGPVDAPGDVIIIAIDEQSARHLGLPDKPRDWPRNPACSAYYDLSAFTRAMERVQASSLLDPNFKLKYNNDPPLAHACPVLPLPAVCWPIPSCVSTVGCDLNKAQVG